MMCVFSAASGGEHCVCSSSSDQILRCETWFSDPLYYHGILRISFEYNLNSMIYIKAPCATALFHGGYSHHPWSTGETPSYFTWKHLWVHLHLLESQTAKGWWVFLHLWWSWWILVSKCFILSAQNIPSERLAHAYAGSSFDFCLETVFVGVCFSVCVCVSYWNTAVFPSFCSQ